MKKNNQKFYILNYVFVIGLLILFLNDHYLKLEFSNWITGKISDFAGVLIAPMIISYFFPKNIKVNIFFVALFFLFWKSSFSQSFIDFYNRFAFISITRVVDYSDLLSLSVLPISYYFLKFIDRFSRLKINYVNPIFFLIPSAILFMATAPPAYYGYTLSEGELKCFKCTKTVNYSKVALLKALRKNGYQIKIDSFPLKNYQLNGHFKDSIEHTINTNTYYKIDTLILDRDTITDFQFALQKMTDNKTKIWINGMNISKEIPDSKVEGKLRRHYRKLIKKQIHEVINDNSF